MANYTKVWRVPFWRGVKVVGTTPTNDCGANLLLVLDGTNGAVGDLPSAVVPATGSTPTMLVGVSPQKLIGGRIGNVAAAPGDVVVLLSDGAINIGDRLTISTTITKEGYAKADTSANVLKVGFALEATTGDGQFFLAVLDPKIAET